MSMNHRRGWLNLFVAAAACAFAAADAGPAEAAGRLASLRAARAADPEAAAPAKVLLVSHKSLSDPNCCAPAVAPCCPKPCVVYRHFGPKICYGCKTPVPTVLTVKDPCTCCPVDISVCLPACCTGAPSVCCHRGLLGRTVMSYDWCCGFRVTVRFLHNGDVVVATHGV